MISREASLEASMSMLTVLSSTHRAHQSLVSMLTGLPCARAHEACVRTTTLGQSATSNAGNLC